MTVDLQYDFSRLLSTVIKVNPFILDVSFSADKRAPTRHRRRNGGSRKKRVRFIDFAYQVSAYVSSRAAGAKLPASCMQAACKLHASCNSIWQIRDAHVGQAHHFTAIRADTYANEYTWFELIIGGYAGLAIALKRGNVASESAALPASWVWLADVARAFNKQRTNYLTCLIPSILFGHFLITQESIEPFLEILRKYAVRSYRSNENEVAIYMCVCMCVLRTSFSINSFRYLCLTATLLSLNKYVNIYRL